MFRPQCLNLPMGANICEQAGLCAFDESTPQAATGATEFSAAFAFSYIAAVQCIVGTGVGEPIQGGRLTCPSSPVRGLPSNEGWLAEQWSPGARWWWLDLQLVPLVRGAGREQACKSQLDEGCSRALQPSFLPVGSFQGTWEEGAAAVSAERGVLLTWTFLGTSSVLSAHPLLQGLLLLPLLICQLSSGHGLEAHHVPCRRQGRAGQGCSLPRACTSQAAVLLLPAAFPDVNNAPRLLASCTTFESQPWKVGRDWAPTARFDCSP